MIPKETVAKILETAEIVDVVSDFISLKKRGANYLGLCPFSPALHLQVFWRPFPILLKE
jgi:DNA primase